MQIEGTIFNDDVTVEHDTNGTPDRSDDVTKVSVSINGNEQASLEMARYDASGRPVLKHVEFRGYQGHDTFNNNTMVRSRAYGGSGNDTLNGGGNRDSLYGGSGSDRIDGSYGTDYINGGRDNDILEGGYGNDTILGEGGSDKIRGEAGNDIIRGGSGIDRLSGGYGNDDMRGGSDHIYGDAGNDVLYGGEADFNSQRIAFEGDQDDWNRDYFYGGLGADYIDHEEDWIDSVYGATEEDSVREGDWGFPEYDTWGVTNGRAYGHTYFGALS